MIATINSFAVPILSLAVVVLSCVIIHMHRKLNKAISLIPANYLMDVNTSQKST